MEPKNLENLDNYRKKEVAKEELKYLIDHIKHCEGIFINIKKKCHNELIDLDYKFLDTVNTSFTDLISSLESIKEEIGNARLCQNSMQIYSKIK